MPLSLSDSEYQHVNKLVTTPVPSAARTATGQSSSNTSPINEALAIVLAVTAVSGTSPSMTLSIEWSNDEVTWAQGDPADAFTAVTTAVNKAKSFTVKGSFYRLVWTITGTTPSFTFSASMRGV